MTCVFVHHNEVRQLPACIIFGLNPEEMTETLLLSKFPSFILSKKREKKCDFFFMRPLGYCIFIYFFICDKISMLFTKGLLASSLDEIRNL